MAPNRYCMCRNKRSIYDRGNTTANSLCHSLVGTIRRKAYRGGHRSADQNKERRRKPANMANQLWLDRWHDVAQFEKPPLVRVSQKKNPYYNAHLLFLIVSSILLLFSASLLFSVTSISFPKRYLAPCSYPLQSVCLLTNAIPAKLYAWCLSRR